MFGSGSARLRASAVPACASRTNCSPDQYGFLPFADGNSGRNILDGPGMQNINASLMKNWRLGESERKRVQFRWEVFNVTNSVRFDVQSSLLSSALTLGSGGSFGNYSGLLTNPRIMQFALRYEF